MTFRRIHRAFLIGIATAALASFSARANEKPQVPVKTGRMVWDCTRYLLKSTARNFSFRALFDGKTVPSAKLDPKTVRPETQAISAAVERGIESLVDFVYAPARRMADLDALTYFPLRSDQKRVILRYVRRTEKELRNTRADYLPGGKFGDSVGPDTLKFFNDELAWLETIRKHVAKPPRKTAARLKASAPDDVGEASGDQNVVFRKIETWVGWLFGTGSRPAKLLRDTRRILLARGESISMANVRIVDYWGDEALADPVLFTDALDFYSRLRTLDTAERFAKKSGIPYANEAMLDDLPGVTNAWAMALETTGGDVSRAMRVIGVFGHDDQAQHFRHSNVYLRLLSFFAPMQDSALYRNGALDGLSASPELRERFRELRRESTRLNERYPKSRLTIHSASFRAGNYHFFGGAMMIHELYRMGNDHFLGVNLPAVAAEVAGKAYKRLTMERSYMTAEERLLFQAGYPGEEVAKPAGWSQELYDYARLKVRLHLLHLELTHEQHLKGAEWAYALLKQHGITRYSRENPIP